MTNKMTATLLEQKFERAGRSIDAFVRECLKANNGRREPVVAELSELFGVSAVARHKLVTDVVERLHGEMRTSAEEVRRSRDKDRLSEYNAKQQKNLNAIAKVRSDGKSAFFQAMNSGLSDGDLEMYVGDESAMRQFVQKYVPENSLLLWSRGDWNLARGYLNGMLKGRRNLRRCREEARRIELQEQKASGFDRMVMALESILVGDKILADCTGADLLREAAKLEQLANGVTAHATFLRQVAVITGRAMTVRAAAGRSEIVRLLENQYREAA